MDEKLSNISAGMEKMKRDPQPQQVPQPPEGNTPKAAHSARGVNAL